MFKDALSGFYHNNKYVEVMNFHLRRKPYAVKQARRDPSSVIPIYIYIYTRHFTRCPMLTS